MPIKTMPIKMILLSLVVLIAIAGAVAAVPLGGGSGGQSENNSVLDQDYDDSWVESVPDIMGGYEVRHINTPKNKACTSAPLISLVTARTPMDDFLASPPDVKTLLGELRMIPGVPHDVRLSFSPTPIDHEKVTQKRANWNERRTEHGCVPPWTDTEVEDLDLGRGWAIFQNKDAGDYTDDNAQGVFITTPSTIGTDQDAWSAVINNVVTDDNYFLQGGMQLKDGNTFIGHASTSRDDPFPDLAPEEFDLVPYYASTEYQFSNTYTSSSWMICAGNNDNIEVEYECYVDPDGEGTHLEENRDTSVWFETANSDEDWHDGFPSTISATSAKIYRDGTGSDWTKEDRWTLHNCGDGEYPVPDAMGTTSLKDGGTGTWTLDELPIVCD